MADPNEPYVEKTVVEEPATVRREVEPARRSNSGWWIAALVAVIAVAGLFFMMNGRTATDSDVIAARESGRNEAMIDNAAAQAQAAAANASEASANAASSMADATRSAADSASSAAERTAQAGQNAAASAADAATDASETAPAPQPQY
jgi:hypothetical protein